MGYILYYLHLPTFECKQVIYVVFKAFYTPTHCEFFCKNLLWRNIHYFRKKLSESFVGNIPTRFSWPKKILVLNFGFNNGNLN